MLANTLAMAYKRIGIWGVLRFRILKLAYMLFPYIGSRYVEWEFVLDYLFPLTTQTASVLDVGATSSLFIYELNKRGYMTCGIDQRPYQEKLPNKIIFWTGDITEAQGIARPGKEIIIYTKFDFITCISTIEHIGIGQYGDAICKDGDKKAIAEMYRILKPDGKLLITTHTHVYSRNTGNKGYTYNEFMELVKDFEVIDYKERKGQILACCVKRGKK